MCGLRTGLATATVILAAAGGARATLPEEAAAIEKSRTACAAAAQAAATMRLGRRATQEDLRYNAPAVALARDCARLRAAPRSFEARAELVASLRAAGHEEASLAWLATLEPLAATAPHGSLRLELLRGQSARARGRHADAETHLDRAAVTMQSGEPLPAELRARLLIERAAAARALSRAQGLERASAWLDEAARLIETQRLGQTYLATELYNERALNAHTGERLEEAAHWAFAERDLVRRLSGAKAPAQLDALASLGVILHQLQRYDEALAALREGREIGRHAPPGLLSARLGILSNLVVQLQSDGQYLEALAAASEAVEAAETAWGPLDPRVITPLDRLAFVQSGSHRQLDARRTYERVQAILVSHGAQVPLTRRVRVLDGIASFLARTGDADQAQVLLEQALAQIPPDELPYWRGRLLRRLGLVAEAKGQWSTADNGFRQAIPLMTGVLKPDDAYLVTTEMLRCRVQLQQRDETPSCTELATRLSILDIATPAERAAARLVLAQLAARQQQGDAALEHLLQALGASLGKPGAADPWSALAPLAEHFRRTGQPGLAVLLAKLAVQSIEKARHQFLDAATLSRPGNSDRAGIYHRLADWLLEDQRIDEALWVMQRLKSEEYSRFIEHRSNEVPSTASPTPWTAAEARWLAASPLESTTTGSVRQRLLAPRQLAEIERNRAEAWRQALRRPLAPESAPAAAAPERPSALIEPDTLVASYVIGEQNLNVVLQNRHGQRLLRKPMDMTALTRAVSQLQLDLAQRQDVMSQLVDLHKKLLDGVVEEAERAGATRLVLRLDGDLRYVPFAALHDGRQFLVERFRIEHRAHGVQARVAEAQGQRLPLWIRAFGSTRAAGNLPPLPGVVAEICALVQGAVAGGCARVPGKGAVPGQGWLDAAFTQPVLRTAAQAGSAARWDMLHIGSHFVLRPGDVGRSWIALGDGGALRIEEMLGWQLRSQELITLSACQTGQGGGSEVEALPRLLLQRGAGAVLASHWAVDDRSTAPLMRRLYERVAAGDDTATALRAAQLAGLARSGLHPADWAGFFLTTRESRDPGS